MALRSSPSHGHTRSAHPSRCLAAWLFAALCFPAGCKSPTTDPLPAEAKTPAVARPTVFAADWQTLTPRAFEHWLKEVDRSGAGLPLGSGEFNSVADALLGPAELSVRAALVLARVPGDGATEILLAFLESRRPAQARGDDAGERTAAAVLAQRTLARPERDRLLTLVVSGPASHPEFAVRVECALALLHQCDDRALGFLLAAARHDTPAARARGESLTLSPTTAWPRWRAASGLESTLGLEPTFDPDMPAARRGELVEEYVGRLRAAGRIGVDED